MKNSMEYLLTNGLRLTKTTTLNDLQKRDISALEKACQQNDHLEGNIFLSNAINFNSEINCFYMLYDTGTLVSFLAMFIPTAQEAEISAYTLPGRRMKGYFKALLNDAEKELRHYSINSILFVHEPSSSDAKAVLRELDAKYEYSEYLLVYNGQNITFKSGTHIKLEQYTNEKIEDIVALNAEMFEEDEADSYSMVEKSLASNDIKTYIAYLNDKMIGICNVNFESEDVSIFGLGISSEYQGKGYGKEMLSLLLGKLLKMDLKGITLEVSSTNERAYNLYRKSGFDIKTQFDYYRYPIK